MAEYSGFFDSHLVDGEYDRVYLAEHFAKYFASFIGNGIFGGKSSELIVREREVSSMGVRVFPGQAFINGYWYENDDEHPLTIDIADGILHRIDSIVVRWNNSNRIIRLAVKKGIASANPIPPTIQRDDDYFELKIADVHVRAGTTRITQANIYDKRLDTNVCGLVIGVVQQLDSEEFGIQLGTFIEEFIAEHNEWRDSTVADIEQWVANFKTSYTNWFNQFKTDSNTAIDNLIVEGQASFNEAIDAKKAEFNTFVKQSETRVNDLVTYSEAKLNQSINKCNDLVDELEEIAADNDLVGIHRDIAALKALCIEDEVDAGCYYTLTPTGEKEWLNPPNRLGIAYRTTERWNGNAVYSKIFYIGNLTNKTVMSVEIGVEYDKIISIAGYALDTDNNMSYPFPIILNGLTPIAVIGAVEGNGAVSYVSININEDLSAFTGYITIKYTI